MACYEISWKKSAEKELKKIPQADIARIMDKVERLNENPYPVGVRKISGSEHTYRIRVGDYRIIYSIIEKMLVIEIVRIGHRGKVYQK
ncbi:type II toxin-antitoxin system RelE/ParE family toxin [bacterium]|nr:type II toxin-antitoxin system RelE/ParE family toxin [bacterium]